MHIKDYVILIQTDKAIYKPSDKIQFRVLALDGFTKPSNIQNAKIIIKDNSSNIVEELENIDFHDGIHQGIYQLPKTPPLGIWSLAVHVDSDEVISWGESNSKIWLFLRPGSKYGEEKAFLNTLVAILYDFFGESLRIVSE